MGIGVLVIGDEILTGKRADKHLAHAIETLGKRSTSTSRTIWATTAGDLRRC